MKPRYMNHNEALKSGFKEFCRRWANCHHL